MTAAVQQSMLSATEAQELTDRIRINVEQLWSLLLQAHEGKAWQALGYGSWSAYIDTEFDMSRSRAYQLLDQGGAIREIEAASGVHHGGQISEREARDIKPHLEIVTDEIRERVAAGGDPADIVPDVIKTVRAAAANPEPPRRKSLTDAFFKATYDLEKSVERLARLLDDDRFTQNSGQIAAKNLSGLARSNDLLQEVITHLDDAKDSNVN